jgi:hypothetical protein
MRAAVDNDRRDVGVEEGRTRNYCRRAVTNKRRGARPKQMGAPWQNMS